MRKEPSVVSDSSMVRIPGIIAGIYMVAGFLWIAFSDHLLGMLVSDPVNYQWLQTVKGWFYVLVTGLLLAVLVRGYLRRIISHQQYLVQSYQELEASYEELQAMESELKEQYETLGQNQKALAEAEEKYRLVVEGTNESVWEWDIRQNRMKYTRTKLLLGYGEKELEDTWETFHSLVHPEDRESVALTVQRYLEGSIPQYYQEYRLRNRWGEYRWVQSRGKAVWDEERKPLRMAGSHADVTEQKRLMKDMYQMAYFDALTSLPNRRLFYEQLHKIITTHRRQHRRFALLTLDLMDFRRINDTRGHEAGDRLLKDVARRLENQLREGSFMARSIGDEFLVLVSGIGEEDTESEELAHRLLNVFKTPFVMDKHEFFLGASIGIALFPDHGNDRDTLLQHADVAMTEAKKAGNNQYRFFDPSTREQITVWMEKENELRHAIKRQEFVLYYQPIIHTKTGKVTRAEALIRWDHPQKGILSPFFFLKLAEDTDLIHPIGDWVLDTACSIQSRWKKNYMDPPAVSINLSPLQFRRTDLPEWIQGALDKYRLPPERIIMEVTETMAMDNLNHTSAVLNRLREMGVRVALDDFGTGYSSLNYLRQLPLDILKIDKSFIDELGNQAKGSSIVRQIIEMAHELGLTVTAEGVEEEAQVRLLKQYGCDDIQGYFYARPMPAEAFEKLLEKEH